jgi:perosamine synthetase
MINKPISEPGMPAGEGSIALCEPKICGNEWKYIKECLDTGWVASVGKYVDRFEDDFAMRVKTKHAVAAVNGTAAIHIALLVAGVERDDEVLISALTFIAPANAIRYVGAWPVFIDSEPDYWQLDSSKLKDFLEKQCRVANGHLINSATGRRVKAVMPVHILGHPVNMELIREIADRFGLVVIEDATESLGAKYKNQPIGSLGDISCFSFNGNKIITTGGGGMIVTNNQAWAERAKYLTTQAKANALEFVHKEIGYNYRLTNIAAAMGVAQLELLDEFVSIKRRIAATYSESFSNLPGIQPMREADWAFSTFWLYTILVDEEKFGMSSRKLIQKLAEANIQARPLWQPMHLSPAMKDCQSFNCAVAGKLNQLAISLPCSVGLSEEQQQKVISVISNRFI